MISHTLFIILPIPALILLITLLLYHLTPLLHLLPTQPDKQLPLLRRLASIIPRPHPNLPREFFNLPPRPNSPSSSRNGYALGVRGKLLLLLTGEAILSLASGWRHLLDGEGRGGGASLAISTVPLPVTILLLSVFSLNPRSKRDRPPSRLQRIILGEGGIHHSTIFPRILPLSLVVTVILTIICAIHPRRAGTILLAFTSIFVVALLVISTIARHRAHLVPRRAPVRLLDGPSGEKADDEEGRVKAMMDSESWITSPSRASTTNLSAFSYSPSMHTPKHRGRASSPSSWLSSPTATPTSIPPWDYSPAIPSPRPAYTRLRSPNPPIDPRPTPRAHKGSGNTTYTAYSYTMTSTPGSALRSAGGSILGGYEPDPFHPMPRSFESLTSYLLSPSQLATTSRTTLGGNIAFVPEEKASLTGRSSSWTLESWYSARERKTPDPKDRRAPPPPPMPCDMPLPPTPTASRSEAVFDWQGKDSMELLVGEKDWVEVERGGEGMDGWGRGGRGVGFEAVFGVMICYASTVPLLANGRSDVDLILYLIALVIPAPALLLATYLLRYHIPTTRSQKKGSTKSTSTHRSLALMSESQLSLPITISPKLTPAEKRVSTLPPQMSRLLEAKPSVSNFGYNRDHRRHTAYETSGLRDLDAEEAMRRMLARRSGDVWIEAGHAVEGGDILSRAAEMMKPTPALCVLDSTPRSDGLLTRLRGGVVSMLPNRLSYPHYTNRDIEEGGHQISPIEISITSPSKSEHRQSHAESMITDEAAIDFSLPRVEIATARLGRMSASPTIYYGRPESAVPERYDVDWLTAGVLPHLVPSIRIGENTRIGPHPGDTPHRPPRSSQFPTSPDDFTPAHQSHGHSSSIELTRSTDFVESPDFSAASQSTPTASSLRQRLRHKASFSLPAIHKTDFIEFRRSMEGLAGGDVGIDLPFIPIGLTRGGTELSPVSERDEGNESSLMRRALHEMAPALSAFDLSDLSNSSARTTSTGLAWSDFAPVVLHGDTIGMTSPASVVTSEEEMADEMERVMAMDTPTRSDSVVSPKSTASRTMHQSSEMEPDIPPSPQGQNTYPSTVTSSTESSLLPIQNFRYSTYALPPTSHPHPPPLQSSSTTVVTDLIAIPDPHPPVYGLATKQSSETLRSDCTATTGSTASPTPAPEFRPSRQELQLVRQLQARGQSTMAVHQDEEVIGAGVGSRRGLRPLQLVDRDANRMSLPLPATLGDVKGKGKLKEGGPSLSEETRKRMSAASSGAGKVSKTSATPLSTGRMSKTSGTSVLAGKARKTSKTSGTSIPAGRMSKGSKASQGSGISGLRI